MSEREPTGGLVPGSEPDAWPYLDNQSRSMFWLVRSWMATDPKERRPYDELLGDMRKNLLKWHESHARGLPLLTKLANLFRRRR